MDAKQTLAEFKKKVDPELEALQRQIAERLGYRLVDHRMELFGVRLGSEADTRRRGPGGN